MTKRTGFLAWLAALGLLLGYEAVALTFGYQSLSQAMVQATSAWPPLVFLIGFVVGGLTCHFWWRWDPATGKGA